MSKQDWTLFHPQDFRSRVKYYFAQRVQHGSISQIGVHLNESMLELSLQA